MARCTVACFLTLLQFIAISWPAVSQDLPEASAELPLSVDLRSEFKQLGLIQREQRGRGTCSVFATVEAVEFARAKQTGDGVAMSVEFANWAANEATARGDDGDFFHNIIKGIERFGLCPESAMPYEKEFSRDTKPSAEAAGQAAEFAKQNPLEFHWIKDWKRKPGLDNADVRKVKTVLASGFPVSAGSYHSVLFVGYEDDSQIPGGGRFFISDSNLRETEITYEGAKERFCDLFWVTAKSSDEKASDDTK